MGQWIDKLGVEIEIEIDPTTDEDGYSRAPDVDGFTATSDGSIRALDGGRAVEYVSDPFEYRYDGIPGLRKGVRTLYEKHNARANNTMGLHVHVSFTRQFYYYALASMRFYRYFMDTVRASELWVRNDRLRERAAGVDFTQPIQSHEELDRSLRNPPGGSSRYRHFIYRPSLETIEFRVFPAMDRAADVLEAVDIVCHAINTYLRRQRYELDEELIVDVETTDITAGGERAVEQVVQYV